MASRGLSSWMSSPMVDASNVRDASTVMLSESPSDMMRTKEIITLISPDKRSLVEAIDSEEDDAEFDERAHWSRRGLKKKVRVSRKSTENRQVAAVNRAFLRERNDWNGAKSG
ncbi:hypothetical protein PsorP6_001085 [Peronosclerospora sorghi]|uniref:Uncharacterized protein n=1 Tax=Peronosclerospora sorghi TaxID=230839 RepID=A0ACC0WUH3_9STRA|nr:hypothetical protein PsorP6_001085 [Peronosclerospora sorghi]